MRNRLALLVFVAGLWPLAGCADQPGVIKDIKGVIQREGIYLRVRELPHADTMAEAADSKWRVAAEPFKDMRIDRDRLGSHTSFWGTKTSLYVLGMDVGQMATLLVIDALKHQKGWDVWLDRPAVAAPEGGPDVTLSAEVLECEVSAKSLLVSTKIRTSIVIVVHARNAADGSTAVVVIRQVGEDWQLWFDPEDAEAQLNKVLHDSLAQLLSRTVVEKRQLRFTPDHRPAQGTGES